MKPIGGVHLELRLFYRTRNTGSSPAVLLALLSCMPRFWPLWYTVDLFPGNLPPTRD